MTATASFSKFVFDPDDAVTCIVFQCACGASIRADRLRATSLGWRRVWVSTDPDAPLSLGEPPRPTGLIVNGMMTRKWSCPDCVVDPKESYAKDAQRDQSMKVATKADGLLLFPSHILGVDLSCCTDVNRVRDPWRAESASKKLSRVCLGPLLERADRLEREASELAADVPEASEMAFKAASDLRASLLSSCSAVPVSDPCLMPLLSGGSFLQCSEKP